MRPFCLRLASCARGRILFHLPRAFPGRKLCTRSVHIHKHVAAPPAIQVYEKWRRVDAFRQSLSIANRATDSTCKLPRQPRIYAMIWAKSYPWVLLKLGSKADQLVSSFRRRRHCCLPRFAAYRKLLGEASACLNQSSCVGGFGRYHRPVRFTQERGHGQKHPSLRPSHIRDSDGTKAQDAIVKETPLIPHVIHGPLEHRAC